MYRTPSYSRYGKRGRRSSLSGRGTYKTGESKTVTFKTGGGGWGFEKSNATTRRNDPGKDIGDGKRRSYSRGSASGMANTCGKRRRSRRRRTNKTMTESLKIGMEIQKFLRKIGMNIGVTPFHEDSSQHLSRIGTTSNKETVTESWMIGMEIQIFWMNIGSNIGVTPFHEDSSQHLSPIGTTNVI